MKLRTKSGRSTSILVEREGKEDVRVNLNGDWQEVEDDIANGTLGNADVEADVTPEPEPEKPTVEVVTPKDQVKEAVKKIRKRVTKKKTTTNAK